jgi:hypothetical protein
MSLLSRVKLIAIHQAEVEHINCVVIRIEKKGILNLNSLGLKINQLG